MSAEDRFTFVQKLCVLFGPHASAGAKADAEKWLVRLFPTVWDSFQSVSLALAKKKKTSAKENMVIFQWALFLGDILYEIPPQPQPQPHSLALDPIALVLFRVTHMVVEVEEGIVAAAVGAMASLLHSVSSAAGNVAVFHIVDHCTIFKSLYMTIKTFPGNASIVMDVFKSLTSMADIPTKDQELLCCIFTHLTSILHIVCDLQQKPQHPGSINNIFRFLGVLLQFSNANSVAIASMMSAKATLTKHMFKMVEMCIGHLHHAKVSLTTSKITAASSVTKNIITCICMILSELPPLTIKPAEMSLLITLFYEVRQTFCHEKLAYWLLRLLSKTPGFAAETQPHALKLILCVLVMHIKPQPPQLRQETFVEGLRALVAFLRSSSISISRQSYDQIHFVLTQNKKNGGGKTGGEEEEEDHHLESVKRCLRNIIECRLEQMILSGNIKDQDSNSSNSSSSSNSAIVLHKHNLCCDVCLQEYSYRLHCTQCRLAKYCSAGCQKIHWFQLGHKAWCNELFLKK